jgi:DNA-directed RNA polymerase specialized sigma24 family protein
LTTDGCGRKGAAVENDAGRTDDAAGAALDGRDADAFAQIVDRWYGSTVRLARVLTHDDALAARAARDAWLLTIDELPRLEGGDALHVTLLAATHVSAAAQLDAGEVEPAVDPASFEVEGSPWQGWWLDDRAPSAWLEPPAADELARALGRLAPAAGAVVLLRDVEGLPPGEVYEVLGFEPEAQRALLHQGRTAIWRTLAQDSAGR